MNVSKPEFLLIQTDPVVGLIPLSVMVFCHSKLPNEVKTAVKMRVARPTPVTICNNKITARQEMLLFIIFHLSYEPPYCVGIFTPTCQVWATHPLSNTHFLSSRWPRLPKNSGKSYTLVESKGKMRAINRYSHYPLFLLTGQGCTIIALDLSTRTILTIPDGTKNGET